MERKNSSGRASPFRRAMSPLRSPMVQRHFVPDQPNIHYPEDIYSPAHLFKKMAINDDGIFRASVDVHDYKPGEIRMKAAGHTIVVELSHDEKEDEFGFISRTFTKKFVLPPTLDMEKISSWTSNGILYIKVLPKDNSHPERHVEIQHDITSK